MTKRRGLYRVLVGKRKGNNHLEDLERSCRWDDNIKFGFQEVGFWDRNWIDLAQDKDRWRAILNVVMNIWVL
jgi:hypothetical protein